MKIALSAVLALLVLLLAALSVFTLRVLTPSGKPSPGDLTEGLTWIRSIYGYGPSEDEQLSRPTDTAIGDDGTIWVTDGARGQVLGFSPQGDFKALIHTGPRQNAPGKIDLISGIGTDEDGHVYLCDYGAGKVMVFTPENEFLREWAVPLPQDVAVRDGVVAVITVNGLGLFDTEGEIIQLVGTRGGDRDQFDGPRGVAVAEDGRIYVSDTHNRRLKAYGGDGRLLWIMPEDREKVAQDDKLRAPTEDDNPFQLPVGMAVDGAGRVVVADAFNFDLVVVDPVEREVVGRYGEFGETDGRFVYPTSLDYDPSRDWFSVADTNNDRAQVIRIEDSGGGLLQAVRRASSGPAWLCAVPLILLLVAVAVAVLEKRRYPERERQEDSPAA